MDNILLRGVVSIGLFSELGFKVDSQFLVTYTDYPLALAPCCCLCECLSPDWWALIMTTP